MKTSRRAASPPSRSASVNRTSRVSPQWCRGWACSSSNPKAEKPSWSRTTATARSSTPWKKAFQAHLMERAPWKSWERKSQQSKQSSMQTAPLKSNKTELVWNLGALLWDINIFYHPSFFLSSVWWCEERCLKDSKRSRFTVSTVPGVKAKVFMSTRGWTSGDFIKEWFDCKYGE